GRSLLDATGVNIAASAGVYWQGLDDNRLKLGAAYLSQPGFGETRMSGTLDGRSGAADVKQDIDFLQTYPDVIRVGGGHRLPAAQVEPPSDFEFVRWSVFDKQCVVLKGKNCEIADNGAAAPGTNGADIVVNIPRK